MATAFARAFTLPTIGFYRISTTRALFDTLKLRSLAALLNSNHRKENIPFLLKSNLDLTQDNDVLVDRRLSLL